MHLDPHTAASDPTAQGRTRRGPDGRNAQGSRHISLTLWASASCPLGMDQGLAHTRGSHHRHWCCYSYF